MKDVIFSQINASELIEQIAQRTAEIISSKKNNNSTTEEKEKSDEWLDLNALVKYDPAKRGKSTWYSKISRGEVPYHKKGKKVFFLKSEIDNWLKSGRKLTNDEVDAAADKYLAKK